MSARPAGLDRRAFIRAGALSAIAVPLWGACGSSKDAPSAGADSTAASVGATRVGNGPLKLDPDTIRFLPIDTGLTFEYDEYVDATMVASALDRALGGGAASGYDVVVLPDREIERVVAAGRELPGLPDRILVETTPEFRPASFDPDRVRSLPWSADLIGIVSRGAGLRDGVGVEVLFDRRYRGKVTLHRDPRVTLGTLALLDGYAADGPSIELLEAAFERVEAAVASGQVQAFATTEFVDHLASGRSKLALGATPGVFAMAFRYDDLSIGIPAEGAVLDADSLLVPAVDGPGVDGARAFVNYCYQPLAAARTVVLTKTFTPVVGAMERVRSIDPSLLSRPVINPNDEVRNRLRLAQPVHAEIAAAFKDLVGLTERAR